MVKVETAIFKSLEKTGPLKALEDLGLELPPTPKAAGSYKTCVQSGSTLYLSGHLPLNHDGSLMTGRIGIGAAPVDHGYAAARQCALNLMATLQNELGDLTHVRIVKVFGLVQSMDDFHEQHKVMNGCSDLLVQVFGKEKGLHVRSAVGTNALPLDASVEVEMVVEISSQDE